MLAAAMRASGWFAVRAHVVLRNRGLILMYHRVLTEELVRRSDVPVQAGMYVTPASLRLHLSWLKAHCTPVSLAELLRRLKAGENCSGCVALTFDDGWRDNYHYGLPLLQEYGLPATVFLASGFIGSCRWFWPEEIGWMVSAFFQGRVDGSMLPPALAAMLSQKGGSPAMSDLLDRIIAEMKQWPESQRTEVTQRCLKLRQQLTGASERLLMNWQEVQEMAATGLVSFGSHTVSHALLDQLGIEAIRREVADCKALIEHHLGKPVELFAYPNGNYNQKVLEVMHASGLEAAVTTKRGYVEAGTPLFELPRIAIHEDVSKTKALLQWRVFVR